MLTKNIIYFVKLLTMYTAFIALLILTLPPEAMAVAPADMKFDCADLARTRTSAEQGDSEAQLKYSWMYITGKCVAMDFPEGAKWITRSAMQGNMQAQESLGSIYYQSGHHFDLAARWFRAAAVQGDPVAQFLLGTMYHYGNAVPQDDSEAVKWFERSAEQGNGLGQGMFGASYREHLAGLKDDIEGDKWMILAGRSEHLDALKKNKDLLESRMSKKDIAEAQKRADVWRPKTELKAQ